MKRGAVAAWRHQLAPRHLLGTATLSASTRIWAEAPGPSGVPQAQDAALARPLDFKGSAVPPPALGPLMTSGRDPRP